MANVRRRTAIPAVSMIPGTTPELDIADTFAKRLAGLLVGPPRPLLLLGTRCIHTFGMRYAIDIWFLDETGAVLKQYSGVPPRRVVGQLSARHILESPTHGHTDVTAALLHQTAQVIRQRAEEPH